jgi:hypothetical protein
VATTTIVGELSFNFALVATSTISTLSATSSGGNIFETGTNSHGTTTPVDIALVSGSSCDTANNLLDFYFEKYVPATGEFVLWVEVDGISSTTPKTVLMYYGFADASATDQSDEAGVFGALGEVGVWNLSEDPTAAGTDGILDSTSNSNDGTDNGSMDTTDQVAGQVDGSLTFTAASTQYVQMSDASLDLKNTFTVMAWTNLTDAAFQGIVAWGPSSGFGAGQSRGIGALDNSGYLFFRGDSANVLSTYSIFNGWHHSAATVTSGNFVSLYADGGLINTGTPALADFTYAGTRIAQVNNDLVEDANGIIDDVRIFAGVLDPMDILTIYNNTLDSTTFWTFGDEETEGAAEAAGGKPIFFQSGDSFISGDAFVH